MLKFNSLESMRFIYLVFWVYEFILRLSRYIKNEFDNEYQ